MLDVLHLVQLGRIPYLEGLRYMREIADRRRLGLIGDALLLMEHPPVLTLGRNAHQDNLRVTGDFLARKGVELHETNRGGDITYHGPGQLVGYPIFDLRGNLPGKNGPHLGPVDFVRLVEEALIITCQNYGVLTQRVPRRTGVWTLAGGAIAEKKIAAIGIHVARGVTTHGFALNVTTDLRDFEWIVPCGIADREVTSLEAETILADPLAVPHAADVTARSFGRLFQRQVLAVDKVDAWLASLGPESEPPKLASPPPLSDH